MAQCIWDREWLRDQRFGPFASHSRSSSSSSHCHSPRRSEREQGLQRKSSGCALNLCREKGHVTRHTARRQAPTNQVILHRATPNPPNLPINPIVVRGDDLYIQSVHSVYTQCPVSHSSHTQQQRLDATIISEDQMKINTPHNETRTHEHFLVNIAEITKHITNTQQNTTLCPKSNEAHHKT